MADVPEEYIWLILTSCWFPCHLLKGSIHHILRCHPISSYWHWLLEIPSELRSFPGLAVCHQDLIYWHVVSVKWAVTARGSQREAETISSNNKTLSWVSTKVQFQAQNQMLKVAIFMNLHCLPEKDCIEKTGTKSPPLSTPATAVFFWRLALAHCSKVSKSSLTSER